jgi:hypothetical protein
MRSILMPDAEFVVTEGPAGFGSVMQALPLYEDEDLETIAQACRVILESRRQALADATDELDQAAQAAAGQKRKTSRARAWKEVKEIDGHAYSYLRWREGNRKRSKYLGKASG